MPTKKIRIEVLADDDSLLPSYATCDSAGADALAAIEEPVTLPPGESTLIPTGLKMQIPSGYEVQVRPRSGLALKHQLTVLNTPGTIDADYRGEVGVILINHGNKPFTVEPRMRIAQLIVAPVVQASYELGEELSTTARGSGGFGHTGLN